MKSMNLVRSQNSTKSDAVFLDSRCTSYSSLSASTGFMSNSFLSIGFGRLRGLQKEFRYTFESLKKFRTEQMIFPCKGRPLDPGKLSGKHHLLWRGLIYWLSSLQTSVPSKSTSLGMQLLTMTFATLQTFSVATLRP